jgi:hypothetical protein
MGTLRRPGPPRHQPAAFASARRAPLVVVLTLFLAACGTTGPATTAPAPGVSPTGGQLPSTAAPAATAAPAETGAPAATGAPTVAEGGTWVAAGQLGTPRLAPHLVALVDGLAMAVGNDAECVAAFEGAPFGGSEVAELWDPASGTWRATASLSTLRAKNAALPLADGRVLVAGGATEGRWDKHADKLGFQSYSSAWTFDPRAGSWAKAGLMQAARTDAAAAVLPDGRVLVAGGYFADLVDAAKYPWLVGGAPGPGTAQLGARAASVVTASWPLRGPLADVAPPQPPGKVLATAELFDPATGTWSSTGSLAVPRYGASAVTLADGRVLVAGVDSAGVHGYDLYVDMGDLGENVGEVYDPRSGRFRVTGEYPARGEYGLRGPSPSATLVALADGGALLVGGYEGDWNMPATVTLRYDPTSNAWSDTGRLGTPRANALAALLPDGKVLVAGGENAYGATASAEVYDPVAGTWSPAPAMPEPRTRGAAAVLADGSVMIAGGYGAHSHQFGWDLCPPPIATTVRFVPAP